MPDFVKRNTEPLIIDHKISNQIRQMTKTVLAHKIQLADISTSLSEVIQVSRHRHFFKFFYWKGCALSYLTGESSTANSRMKKNWLNVFFMFHCPRLRIWESIWCCFLILLRVVWKLPYQWKFVIEISVEKR